jgi:hypothetical protein
MEAGTVDGLRADLVALLELVKLVHRKYWPELSDAMVHSSIRPGIGSTVKNELRCGDNFMVLGSWPSSTSLKSFDQYIELLA